MQFETFEEVIAFAIEKEEEAVAFYKAISEEENRSGVKEMFLEFSTEEKRHVAVLENLDQAKSEKYKVKPVNDLKRSDYTVDVEYSPGMDYKELLMLAIKREERALKLYAQLQQKVDKEEVIKVFQVLENEEAKHKLKLETIYDDYMAELGD